MLKLNTGFKRFLPLVPFILFGLSASSFAAEQTNQGMTQLLQMRLGGIDVTPAERTPLNNVFETSFANKYGYLLEGGRYVIIGDLIDLEAGQNLTEFSRRQQRVDVLSSIKDSDKVIYPAKGTEKNSITVFTDTSCPYCTKLHKEVEHLQEAGITVKYMPFPRGSSRGPGYKGLKQVWCSKNKERAMHIAKGTELGKLTEDTDCESASLVDKGFIIGNQLGVTGTPAIFTAQGEKFDGYVPYKQLIPRVLK